VSPSTPSASPASDIAATTVDPTEAYFFQSPTKNIVCSLALATATCQIGAHDYEPPPTPADCEFDYGQMVAVKDGASAAVVCHSDTAFGPDHPVLPYEAQVSNGKVTCRSTESAMECSTVAGTHGFELARARYRVY
jgi:hypothetical protein